MITSPVKRRPRLKPAEPKETPTRIHLNVQDLSSKGSQAFFAALGNNPHAALAGLVTKALGVLYPPRLNNCHSPPFVASISFQLHSFAGVAYTAFCDPPSGTETEQASRWWSEAENHKAIHLSTDYIEKLEGGHHREIEGILLHQIAICFSYGGLGTCPTGIIEGIADFVRLRGNLASPDWNVQRMERHWDAGNETTAYFFDFLSAIIPNLVPLLISKLATEKWNDGECLETLMGVSLEVVEEVWRGYRIEGKVEAKAE